MLIKTDGGGIRGISTLIILNVIMELVSKHEEGAEKRIYRDHRNRERYHPLKPCHYFDFIIGTSTGG